MLWEASDRMCGKRLKTHFPMFLPVLERLGHLRLDPSSRAKLLTISAATIDRLLHELRTTSPNVGVGLRTVAHRSSGEEILGPPADAEPGHAHLHLGSYARRSVAGGDVQILSLTDWFSGWAECAPVASDEPGEVLESFDALRERLPFELRRVLLDGKVTALEGALASRGNDLAVEVYRSPSSRRAVRTRTANGGDPVRRLARPFEVKAAEALETLRGYCTAATTYGNFFRSSFGLEKRGLESRNTRDTAPETPAMRLLRSGVLGEPEKLRLQAMADKVDPLQLLAELRALQSDLVRVRDEVEPSGRTLLERRSGDLRQRPLRVPRQAGEQSSNGAKPQRHWRTHKNAFEGPWPIVQTWLEITTHQSSKELFERLRREYPGVYREGQLRSFQRRLKQSRSGLEPRFMPSTDGVIDGEHWPSTDRTDELDELR
jgi:hypothetical protein